MKETISNELGNDERDRGYGREVSQHQHDSSTSISTTQETKS